MAPKTRVRILGEGAKPTLQFTVRDASPVSTYVKYGKRVKEVKKTLRLPAARLRKGAFVQSVDAFGNVERARRFDESGPVGRLNGGGGIRPSMDEKTPITVFETAADSGKSLLING